MSPRRARRRDDDARPLRTDGLAVTEEWPDGDWVVRAVTGDAATKTYRCPGCDHEIPPGLGHEVVVPHDTPDLRRHWHSSCWRRATRPPRTQASRSR